MERNQTTREMDSNAIQLDKHLGMYWVPGMVTETLNGVPLSSNPETASTVVKETVMLATDPDITMQLGVKKNTKTQDITTQREHGQARCTSRCTPADQITEWKGSGTCTRTDLRQARTEVRPRWEGITSPW